MLGRVILIHGNVMRVLALEPYYGGSHRAFLDGWIQRSAHQWTVLTLPPYKWKWRMRHAPLTLADQVRERCREGDQWDVVWCSDMLSLAEFRGLIPGNVAALPCIAYFHENQLTYPAPHDGQRDHHYAFTNFTTACAADSVWFNSAFHRDDFLVALRKFLAKMPDHQPLAEVNAIEQKSTVQWPGVDTPLPRPPRVSGPLRILWSSRWEHDKGPETLFAALEVLQDAGASFEVNVLGESFQDVPDVFAQARQRLGGRVRHWGYQDSRHAYWQVLASSDVYVSTAEHEFFGIAAAEAIAAGTFPVLPRRLAYPELIDECSDAFFYDGSVEQLVEKLTALVQRVNSGEDLGVASELPRRAVERFDWEVRAAEMDRELSGVRQ